MEVKDRFINPIVITCRKDRTIKLVLDSNFINKQFYKNKNQTLVDNVASQSSNQPVGDVGFINLDLKNASLG